MTKRTYTWKVLHKEIPKSIDEVSDILLRNRGITTQIDKDVYFSPKHPLDIQPEELGIDTKALTKATLRIMKAIENDETIIVYGDYDADGVCATAILWKTIYRYTKNVIPFMPDRFIDGYGLHPESVKKLKEVHPMLSVIVTVDNGIVATAAVETARDLGIDVIVTDHHQIGSSLPPAYAIVHTDKVCGSAVSFILARELNKKRGDKKVSEEELDLTGIGTIADQMPLISYNRSFAHYGLVALNNTKRLGLLALYQNAALEKGKLTTYEINFQIAPRINAMGRLENAMDALRLLCTTDASKARSYAIVLGKVNSTRQKMLEGMVSRAKSEASKKEWLGAIVLGHETYHEGVIGLIASKLVEEFYRPAIVLSIKDDVSKASARSVQGFNIIQHIRKLDHLIVGGGGHPMAAGFSIKTESIDAFTKEMELISSKGLTGVILTRELVSDCELSIDMISKDLCKKISQFQPFGIGNPTPLFFTQAFTVLESKLLGKDKNHVKLKVQKEGSTFEAIAFSMPEIHDEIHEGTVVDMMYSIEENNWNGKSTIQLKVKDIHIL